MSVSESDIRRYKVNYIKEQEGIALYRAMAKAEKDPARAEIFEKLAAAEERHAERWARLLEDKRPAEVAQDEAPQVRLELAESENAGRPARKAELPRLSDASPGGPSAR